MAASWYEECISTPIVEEYYYLTETKGAEADLSADLQLKIAQGDSLFQARKYKAAALGNARAKALYTNLKKDGLL